MGPIRVPREYLRFGVIRYILDLFSSQNVVSNSAKLFIDELEKIERLEFEFEV